LASVALLGVFVAGPALCAATPRQVDSLHALMIAYANLSEIDIMYIGGGLVGAILVIALIVFLMRRA
jgi:hypothetical protein